MEMESKRSLEAVPDSLNSIDGISRDGSRLPPWLFRHRELEDALEKAQKVDQKTLINTFNYIHFMDGDLLFHLRHSIYEESILVRAYPDPCLGKELTCRLSDDKPSPLALKDYQFLHLIIDDGRSMILIPLPSHEIRDNSLTVQLPETGYAVGQRQSRRYACKGVTAELTQSGFYARGELMDFNPLGFRVKVRPAPNCSFNWFNPDESMDIHLKVDQQIIFSGSCNCIRQSGKVHVRDIVAAPVNDRIRRFKKKELRNLRQKLVPSPSVIFTHPLLNKRIERKGFDISTSGFSIYEEVDESVLIPGMIIPEMIMKFPGGPVIRCTTQVIYSHRESEKRLRCGLSILDMGINEYSLLTHILTNALDPNAYISCEVDMDSLWEFFFDTGFIYPTKYRLIHSNREDFKETYRKLYQESPQIARHFTSQKDGKIYGHMSMIRAYNKTWLIHHHAARAMDSQRTGFLVLKQIMHYMNDMYRLPSAKMDYVMCYYRPENKFPDRVFGGFARSLDNPKGCSMDLFAYLPYTSLSLITQLPDGWAIRESNMLDIWELNRFYSHSSGGLLLDALGLERRGSGDKSLEETYSQLGFTRKWRSYSLTHNGELKTILIANHSDLGINLSELLNCIKVLVIDPEDMPWNVLSIAISRLTSEYEMERVPVLFYPFNYVEDSNIPFEKRYLLWIYDAHYVGPFMEYMQKRFRISYKKKEPSEA